MTNAVSKPAKPAPTIAELDKKPLRIIRLVRLLSLAGAAYGAYKVDWKKAVKSFFTGPGRIGRILMLIFALLNWKNMPFVWTVCAPPSLLSRRLLTSIRLTVPSLAWHLLP